MEEGILGFRPIFHRSKITFSRALTLSTKGSRNFISLNQFKRMFNSSPDGIVAKYKGRRVLPFCKCFWFLSEREFDCLFQRETKAF